MHRPNGSETWPAQDLTRNGEGVPPNVHVTGG